MQSAEPNAQQQTLAEPKAILALVEYASSSNLRGTPIRFVLYSNRTVIYQGRNSQYTGFVTGNVDDDTWQSFEKILTGLPELEINFEINQFDLMSSSLIVFNQGKRTRHIAMNGPISATKTGSGRLASYAISAPSEQSQSLLWGSVEVPQCALGAWYEMHNFVPNDAHPWVPNYFDVSLVECTGDKPVPWPASWPQLKPENKNDFPGYSLQIPGIHLSQFQKLFNKPRMLTRIAGQTFLIVCTVSLPFQGPVLSATPMGFNYEPPKILPLLPQNFLQKTKLADVKKVARERNYNMQRIVSADPSNSERPDIIEVLCESNDLDEIDAAIELTIEAQRGLLRRASMIASTHTPGITKDVILRHVADRKFSKIIIPLIQESVARGACYEDVEPISTFWKALSEREEPLAWLPLHRVDTEHSAAFRRYRGGASAMHIPSSNVTGELENLPSGRLTGKSFKTVPLPLDQVSVARCVRKWEEHSNGKIEAKLFQTTSPITTSDLSAKHLLNLQLECLASATPKDVKVDIVTPEHAFAILFLAASCGGAYTSGEEGAYGRLAAWKSLAALVGVADSASFDEVSSAVKQSDWCSFEASTEWFYNVAWDFGIVCVRPDKRHIAVLAASDED
ncbi:MAG: DUF6183 family protein [Candidatus Melainabacteria bacterium]|nr:DUF6183 family protein [Candidatus Melainabacteria bacterium]